MDARTFEKILGIKLSECETARINRRDEVEKFADEIVKQCQQQNFTIKEFGIMVEKLSDTRQILESHAADITRLGD